MPNNEIENAIPHRPPFLLVDTIKEIGPTSIVAAYTPRPEAPLWQQVYAGHYPGQPITPGVLLCEMVLQAAAVLASHIARDEHIAGLPVVTRLENVKFKKIVPPDQTLEIHASLKERLANAFFMKGSLRDSVGIVLHMEFAVAFTPAGNES